MHTNLLLITGVVSNMDETGFVCLSRRYKIDMIYTSNIVWVEDGESLGSYKRNRGKSKPVGASY